MSSYSLEQFIIDCRERILAANSASEYVDTTAPCMFLLLNGAGDFLRYEHYRSGP